jgi:hypothetical protein
MTSATLNRLRSEALELPEEERAELARDLIRSLDAPADSDAAEAWDREIARRLSEIDSGAAELIDRAELRRLMEQRIRNA